MNKMELITAPKLITMITKHLLDGNGSVIRIPFALNTIPRLEAFLANNSLTYTYTPATLDFYPDNTVILSISK